MKFTRLVENKTNIVEISPDDIEEITLLSVEEAQKLPKSILATGDWWWLRSPGNDLFSAALVNNDGVVNDYGYFVNYDSHAVRPALQISDLNSLNIKVGDAVRCLGKKWYYVGDNLILLIYDIGYHCFNEDSDEIIKKREAREDIFEGSDIQKYLQQWLKTQLKEQEKLDDLTYIDW